MISSEINKKATVATAATKAIILSFTGPSFILLIQ